MTKTTARPAQLAPVRIGKGVRVHLGHLSSIQGPNGEPRYCSWCPASAGRDGAPFTAGEAVTEEIDCRSCQRQASAEALQRAADAAQAARTAKQIEADGANPGSAAQPSVAVQSIDLTGAICMDTKPHQRHRIIGSFRGGCSGIPATLPNLRHDHNGQCIGCGAFRLPTVVGAPDGEDYWCASTCGFRTGTVSPAMILRAAARSLDRFPRGRGADLRAVLDAVAVALTRTEDTRGAGEDLDVEDLVESARDALAAYFDEVAGPDAVLPGAEFVDQYAVIVPRQMIAETLYFAAARNDGVEFDVVARERLLGEGLGELERCCPDAETLLVGITGPDGGPHEVECLGVVNHDETYVNFGAVNAGEEDPLAKAGELIIRALTISLPPYLRQVGDDDPEMYEITIADTLHGQTRQR
jgi:hypothetical protein